MVADFGRLPVCQAAPTSVKGLVERAPVSATTPCTAGSGVSATSATCGDTGCGGGVARARTGTAMTTGTVAAATPSKDRKRRKEDLRFGSEGVIRGSHLWDRYNLAVTSVTQTTQTGKLTGN